MAGPRVARLKMEEFRLLRLLGTLGAAESPVELSSREVGEKMGVRQQAADRYLVALERRGAVTRHLAGRRQRLAITPEGLDELRKEYHQLRRMFDGPARIRFGGRIASGLGEGRYYLSQPGYVAQFSERLGYRPFPGTLNIRVRPEELPTTVALRHWRGIRIDGFQASGRTFGGATCFSARISGSASHLIVPDRTHYKDVVELIAPVSLREALKLRDDDLVEVEVEES